MVRFTHLSLFDSAAVVSRKTQPHEMFPASFERDLLSREETLRDASISHACTHMKFEAV